LENEGNNRLSKNSFIMADNYFSYLLRLDPNSKQRIAQAYLDLFNQTDDGDEFKTVIIDRAVEISQEQNITEVHGKHYCELSEQEPTTEGAIGKLKIANWFGNLYSHELKSKQVLLKQEQFLIVVKKYESKWGSAKVVKLTESNKWKEVFPMNNQENFYYLSLKSFYANDKKCSDGQINFDSAIKKHGKFRVSCKKSIILYCSALHTPITLYAWKM
ncbi:MAG: hypothetical protein U9M94_03255, partial [Patescibacteria group bacterium]|nr:hypothetical protein [Patescibacteria group bacterium]